MDSRKKIRNLKYACALIVAVFAFSLIGSLQGGALPSSFAPNPAYAAASAKARKSDSVSKLSLLLNVQDKEKGSSKVAVSITGKSKSGKQVDKQQNVKIGVETKVKVGPGTYKVSISSDSVQDDENAYQANEAEIKYDGKCQTLVVMQLSIDTSATEQKKADKAAAEEAAQAEAQRQAEEAAQQAEAQRQAEEQARQQQEAAAAAQAQQNTETVYVTRTGGKYHKAGCRYLRSSSIAISLSSAQSQGYTACSVCGG